MLGVFDFHVLSSTVGGVGVRNRTSSFDSTASGLNGTSPAPLNPPWILLFVIDAKKAPLKHGRNSSLVMWLMWLRIRSSTWRPYAFFKGEKHPTSSGWSRCDECGGMQRVIILLSLQYCWNSIESWLSWPSIMSRRYSPAVRLFVCASKCFSH